MTIEMAERIATVDTPSARYEVPTIDMASPTDLAVSSAEATVSARAAMPGASGAGNRVGGDRGQARVRRLELGDGVGHVGGHGGGRRPGAFGGGERGLPVGDRLEYFGLQRGVSGLEGGGV